MKSKILLLIVLITAFTVSAVAQPSIDLDVQKIKTEPVPLQTSEYADVWVKVVNRGDTTAEPDISFRETYPFSTDSDEKTSWDIGTITPGEEYHVHLRVKVDENAVHGENNLIFKTSDSGTSIEHEVPVEVRSDNNILSVENVYFPDKIGSGETDEMVLELENLADSYLKNIQVSLDPSDLPLATSEANTRTLKKVEPGSKTNISFRINVDQDAENGVYSLPLELEYENEAGNEFTRNTETGIVVGGEPVLEPGFNSLDVLTSGSRSEIGLRLVNKGAGSAKFVEMALKEGEGYRILSTEDIYLGEMDPDDYQTAEYDLFIEEEGRLSVPVEVTYVEGSERKTETHNLEMNVYSSEEASRFSPGGGSILPLIVVGLLVLGGVYYWRKRR